jgi:hypothetical protein
MKIHESFPRYERHSPAVPVWCLTPHEGRCIHRFFDTSPLSPSGRYAAVFRMPFEDRLPEPGEPGQIVVIDLAEGTEWVAAETYGWEPQMGANLNWAGDERTLVFNDVDRSTWTPQIVKLDWPSGRAQRQAGGVYQVSPDGRYAAAASMERMRRTQLGYGVMVPDDRVSRHCGAPADDGLFIVDLQTGERRLLLCLADAVKAVPDLRDGGVEAWEIYGFHTKWSAAGDRLIFTLRRFAVDAPQRWNALHHRLVRFDVLTLRPDGSGVVDALPAERWRSGGHHINFFPDGCRLSMNLGGFGEGLRFVACGVDGSNLRPILDDVVGSGHPTVHPGGCILTDSYVHEQVAFGDGSVPLRWVDMSSGAERTLVRIHSRVEPTHHQALRVDPHPAWHRDGRHVVFNGVEGNTRRVYLADLGGVIGR